MYLLGRALPFRYTIVSNEFGQTINSPVVQLLRCHSTSIIHHHDGRSSLSLIKQLKQTDREETTSDAPKRKFWAETDIQNSGCTMPKTDTNFFLNTLK